MGNVNLGYPKNLKNSSSQGRANVNGKFLRVLHRFSVRVLNQTQKKIPKFLLD